MARALTASEATSLLISKGYASMFSNHTNWIADNDYTRKWGEFDFRWENPEHNRFNPALAYWKGIGRRYSVCVYEDGKGRSNILLDIWDGQNGKTIVSYNKLNAAGKKEFLEMCLNAERISYDQPFRVWDGWKDESYRDERGVWHTAWRTPDGVYHTTRELI